MAGLRVLVPPIGVRVPIPEPSFHPQTPIDQTGERHESPAIEAPHSGRAPNGGGDSPGRSAAGDAGQDPASGGRGAHSLYQADPLFLEGLIPSTLLLAYGPSTNTLMLRQPKTRALKQA